MKRIPYEDLKGLIAKLEEDQRTSMGHRTFTATEISGMYFFTHIGPYKAVCLNRRPIVSMNESGRGNIYKTQAEWKLYDEKVRNTSSMNILSASEYANIILGLYDHRDSHIVNQLVELIARTPPLPFNIMTLTEIVCTKDFSLTISPIFDGRRICDTQAFSKLQNKEDIIKHVLSVDNPEAAIRAFCWFTGCTTLDVEIGHSLDALEDKTSVLFYKYGTTCKIIARYDNPNHLVREEYIGLGARIEYYDGKP